MITWLSIRPSSNEMRDDNSLNEETEDDGSLLNQAKTGPFNVIAKALHRTGS